MGAAGGLPRGGGGGGLTGGGLTGGGLLFFFFEFPVEAEAEVFAFDLYLIAEFSFCIRQFAGFPDFGFIMGQNIG